MAKSPATALVLLCLSFSTCAWAAGSPGPDRVLVLYNINTSDADGDGTGDSLQVANYYRAKRGVPAGNLLGLSISVPYYSASNYALFHSEIVQPIKSKLSALGAANIDILLLCYGVPARVADSGGTYVCLDNVLMGLNYWSTSSNNISRSSNAYFATRPTFETDKPHFSHGSYKFRNTEMYLVGRLAGADVRAAMNLVDQALYAERYFQAGAGFYNGIYYVDSRYAVYTDEQLSTDPAVTSGSYSSYQNADKNMAYAEHYVGGTGLELKWENTASGATIGTFGAMYSDGSSAQTAPRAFMYGGWYSNNQDGFEWLPGSVACHLHSLSFAQGTGGFCGAALARGASCVSGTIGEPYLSGHQRPNVLLYYILKGYTFAEASTLSTPSVGWMDLNAGDPLYTPFKAKTPLADSRSPALASGFPAVTGNQNAGTRPVHLKLEDVPEPEVARIEVEYGLTTAYGSVAHSGPGYYRFAKIDLTGLQGNSIYHYRVRLTDPVGNVTLSGDYTFTTGNVPNTAPVAQNQSLVIQHDLPRTIALVARDAEGNALTFSQVTPPAHGNVTISGATATYTPAAGYSGADSFAFKAHDGALDSNTATVSLAIMPTDEVTVVLQQGRDGYTGARDTKISSGWGEDTWNWGGAQEIVTYAIGARRSLLAFDLTSIPADATISGAKLELFCSGAGAPQSGNDAFRLYSLTRAWVEGTSVYHQTQDGATWYEPNYVDGTATPAGDWTTFGGDFDSNFVAERPLANGEDVSFQWVGMDFQRGVVQDWVSGALPNHGVLLQTHTNYWGADFCSKEYAADPTLRPKLTIRYFPAGNAPPAILSAPWADPNPVRMP